MLCLQLPHLNLRATPGAWYHYNLHFAGKETGVNDRVQVQELILDPQSDKWWPWAPSPGQAAALLPTLLSTNSTLNLPALNKVFSSPALPLQFSKLLVLF